MTALVAVLHAGLAAAWVGGMAYSLFVVQPKVAEFYRQDPEGRELLTVTIASGNRWKVLGLIATIAASGLALLAVDRDGWWIHLIKAVLLLAATGLFWYVSWRHWPRRLFATAAELPAYQARLRLLATVMLVLAGLAFALGVVAAQTFDT
jgi:Flp pilus assembly protein TadB